MFVVNYIWVSYILFFDLSAGSPAAGLLVRYTEVYFDSKTKKGKLKC